MNNFEFMGYEPTPTEPKQLGIATIRAWGKVILRYKIVPGKDGNGWFSNIASFKKGPDATGKDMYTQSFMVDSNFEAEQIKELIKANVNPYANKATTFAPQSTNANQMPQYTNQPGWAQQRQDNAGISQRQDPLGMGNNAVYAAKSTLQDDCPF